MKSNRLITLATITLLCVAHADVSWAQAKKESKKGGSEPAMDHAKKGMELAQMGANDEAIAEFTKAIERLTRRKVTAFLSANQTTPGVACELFFLEAPPA